MGILGKVGIWRICVVPFFYVSLTIWLALPRAVGQVEDFIFGMERCSSVVERYRVAWNSECKERNVENKILLLLFGGVWIFTEWSLRNVEKYKLHQPNYRDAVVVGLKIKIQKILNFS